ncbi:hypothetical protein ACMFMF_005426 [Clarireedia jacksonii]
MHSTSKTTALCKIHTADFKEYITCLRRLDEFEILVSRPITITSEEVVYPRAGSVSTTTKTDLGIGMLTEPSRHIALSGTSAQGNLCFYQVTSLKDPTGSLCE